MHILCFGLNHRTAPIEIRERLSFTPQALKAALARFRCGPEACPPGVVELAVLSTCNRLELYAVAPAPTDAGPVFAALRDFVAEARDLPAAQFESHLYYYTGTQAVDHLCRVASGLDSMILGEPQILGQVVDAYEAAAGQQAIGPVLSAAFQAAIRAGKRARTETAIARNPASVSSVAIRLAETVVGAVADQRVLVVGAGEMGSLAVEALRARGVRRVTVVNRTRQRALELAERWNGRALSLEQLTEALRDSDIVITSTGAPHFLIHPHMVQEVLADRAQPLVFIDIAIPRDVDPAVGKIAGVHLFDLDRLHVQLEGALADRQNEIPQVEAIVAEEGAVFAHWLKGLDIMPLIADLRARAEQIRRRELDRTLRALPDLDPETRRRIERLSESLINKLLHEPTLKLRGQAGNGHAAQYAHTVRFLFGLPAEAPSLAAGSDDA